MNLHSILCFPFAAGNKDFSQRMYLNHPDSFCYIWGEYNFMEQKKSISDYGKKAYLSFFKIKPGDQDKTWVPHIVCKT